ncbi:MAG: glycine cleavage system aminomethyltransferase GcvT [Chloroflexi bacterium]|nr:MAG: glycine cleavage system aminomethyltransferase GcvT [Chloroflexota bacterium]
MASRRTPLHAQQLAVGARMVDFAGWELPQQYRSVKDEQEAVRTAAGVFDVSHMGRYEVRGAAAGDFLQGVVTNDLGRLPPNRAQYNLLCRPDGGIVDDLVVYRGDPAWFVVVNAANREKDMSWLREHAPAGVEVVDRSDELGLLAVQGPRAEEQLPVADTDLAGLRYFGIAEATLAGARTMISRTGYTGEDGFELFVPAASLAATWDALLRAGVQPCGLAARDVCRLEAGLRLYGSDMDETTNPYEAGLGWTVKLGKGDFVGREALLRIKEVGPSRELVGLGCADRGIPRHGAVVRLGGRDIGVVTSGTYSFWLRRGIAMAFVEAGAAPLGGQVEVATRSGEAAAEVVPLPFYRGSARRAAVTQG